MKKKELKDLIKTLDSVNEIIRAEFKEEKQELFDHINEIEKNRKSAELYINTLEKEVDRLNTIIEYLESKGK